MKNKNLRFAVTGASGFLGSYMIEHLKKKGYFVRAILHHEHKQSQIRYQLADQIIKKDLTKLGEVISAFKGIDMVFHFAADMGGVGYFSQRQYFPFIHNMQIDMNTLIACEKTHVKRLFYPSSACIYPTDAVKRLKTTKLREDMIIPANPDQMYGWEKLVITVLSQYTPVEIRVGILHTIFGKSQEWSGERTKFPGAITYKVIQSKNTGEPIHIWGDGSQIRTFLYVTDAIEKIYRVMMGSFYKGPVNISSDEQVTVKECADWLCEFAKIKPRYIFEVNKPTGVRFRGVDNSKFNKLYAYSNKVSTKEGFRKIYEDISSRMRPRDSATKYLIPGRRITNGKKR